MLLKYLLTFCIILLLFLLTAKVYAQNDSLRTPDTENIQLKPPSKRYSPRKATLMSAAFPGLGQAYVKKYWKMPIIYAGAGVLGYLIVDNHRQYITWRDRYIGQRLASENGLELPYINPATGAAYPLDNLVLRKNYYRRNRDFNVILSGLLYALNILDANVSAHLKDFDLSNDLSMSVKPDFSQPGMPYFTTGISLTFNLK